MDFKSNHGNNTGKIQDVLKKIGLCITTYDDTLLIQFKEILLRMVLIVYDLWTLNQGQ